MSAPVMSSLTDDDLADPFQDDRLRRERSDEGFVGGVPDVIVEAAPPVTRRPDLVNKRSLYEREGLAGEWYWLSMVGISTGPWTSLRSIRRLAARPPQPTTR